MPLSDTAYTMRDRAESFGAVAASYDRYRPAYPEELIADLCALADRRPVLDIGTGTGKAARMLADRGCEVLGVEIDPLMADLARSHGLQVEVAAFESWADAGRRFGLITAAQAWHWVDPGHGAPKVARLLLPGASFAPFWNFEELEDTERAVALEVYRELAPELVPAQSEGHRPHDRPYVSDLRNSGAFAAITTRTYRWVKAYSIEDWIGRIGTHSDHLALGSDRLALLLSGLRAALGALGPELHTTGGTYLVLAEVAS